MSFSQVFTNPILPNGADPWIIQRDGCYYYCVAVGGNQIQVLRSRRLHELHGAECVIVYTAPPDTSYSKELWAPELHFLDGRWYIYVAADDGDNFNHRMYVLEGDSSDPQKPFHFRGKIAAPTDRWAIDGTVLTSERGMYFIWSGWEGALNVQQNLYIAPMSNPWTISGERALISEPEYDWEKRGSGGDLPTINEGPQVLKSDGKVHIIYSASGSWCDNYCLGQLTYTGGDMLSRQAWKKKSVPVFSKTDKVFGPGHASFVKSPNGQEDCIVYHAAKHSGAGWKRNIRMQRFTWNADGSPNFGEPIAEGRKIAAPAE